MFGECNHISTAFTRPASKHQIIKMSPVDAGADLSARRAQFAGPAGVKGIIQNGKTTAIATFAALGGFVYGCESNFAEEEKEKG